MHIFRPFSPYLTPLIDHVKNVQFSFLSRVKYKVNLNEKPPVGQILPILEFEGPFPLTPCTSQVLFEISQINIVWTARWLIVSLIFIRGNFHCSQYPLIGPLKEVRNIFSSSFSSFSNLLDQNPYYVNYFVTIIRISKRGSLALLKLYCIAFIFLPRLWVQWHSAIWNKIFG